eukprot:PhF_6_TR30587/c0_g1_i2/m.44997
MQRFARFSVLGNLRPLPSVSFNSSFLFLRRPYCEAAPSEAIEDENIITPEQPLEPSPALEDGEIPVSELTPDERRLYYARSWGHGKCALCCEPVVDWLGHIALPTHKARNLVCRSIASAEKYSIMLTNLWHYLHFDAALIREFDVKRDSTRRARIHDTIKFLHEHNVLLYSPYRWSEEKFWVRTVDFAKCFLAGETVVRAAVIDRLARIFPNATADELHATTEVIMDIPAMSALYDVFQLNALLPHPQRREHKVSPQMKRAMVLAMCGEMNWFVAKSRATDRSFNNTLFPPSDTLVVHVLCHHTIESLLLEVVHYNIQKILKENLNVWSDFRSKLPYIAGKVSTLAKPKTIYPMPQPRKPKAETTDSNSKVSTISAVEMKPPLSQELQRCAPIPTILPKAIPTWRDVVKDLSLSGGVKGMTPKISQRRIKATNGK